MRFAGRFSLLYNLDAMDRPEVAYSLISFFFPRLVPVTVPRHQVTGSDGAGTHKSATC
jgi:hypothetical protein